jgi:hypothetical protein
LKMKAVCSFETQIPEERNPLCQLAFSGYPDSGFSVLFPQL